MTGSDRLVDGHSNISEQNCSQSIKPYFSSVIIVPTYNNSRTLADILNRIDNIGLPVIVVNDGSTDSTLHILAGWRSAGVTSPATRIVVEHAGNFGKAAALLTGFSIARERGYTHAVTIDSDGQLYPEQIPDLLAVARAHSDALVLGVRDASRSNYPIKSRWGRELSNYLIWLECGKFITDSQCGLRVYPLAMVTILKCGARRYCYETEIITRAVWAGWKIREVPVNCRYFQHGEHVSHFNPWLDSARSLKMHINLLLASMKRIWRRFLPLLDFSRYHRTESRDPH
jgi:glycosyltransferase involved in cell wall biosynthesis